MDPNKILHDSITELFRLAARDGVITLAEQNIIDQVEIDVTKYREILNIALEDNEVDSLEHKILEDFAKRIVENAEKVAFSDGVYSRNEKDLIQKLNKIIRKYYDL